MIYRDKKTIYYPQLTAGADGKLQENGLYQAETMKSINAAKRAVREGKLTVRRGRPPTRTAALTAAASVASNS